MIGERGTRRKTWCWLALVWLGALLMLGALALPARAIAGGFVAPAMPATPGLETAPAQIHKALTTQDYVVTSVGLKDFLRKDFGVPARSSASLTPIPTASLPAPETSPGLLQDASADYCFLPTQDRVPETITMRPEDRRRWLKESLNAASVCWRMTPALPSSVAATPDRLCRPPASALRGGERPTARWAPRIYPAGTESPDAGEDPAGDPPPPTRPLLSPQPNPKITILPQTTAFILAGPDLPARLGLDDDKTPLIPRPLLAWPTLRVRPPPAPMPSLCVALIASCILCHASCILYHE